MEDWLLHATTTALARMCEHATVVDLCNTDEATFRSFFMAAIRSRWPQARLETEWCYFDLLVQNGERNALVEFKYYVARRNRKLDGSPGQWKGGAGVQNEREFWDCVRKLRACSHEPMHARYLVLVYERFGPDFKKRTYEASYGSIVPSELITAAESLNCGNLECRVLHML